MIISFFFTKVSLFRYKIFFIIKYFQMKIILRKIIFFLYLIVFRKIFYSVVRKIEQKRWGETCIFGKWFTKKLGVNYFLHFNKWFFGQRKLFFVWPPFYSKTNTDKSENIFINMLSSSKLVLLFSNHNKLL